MSKDVNNLKIYKYKTFFSSFRTLHFEIELNKYILFLLFVNKKILSLLKVIYFNEGSMKKEKENGKTVLYSTHYMEEAQYLCDRILMIYEGRKVAFGDCYTSREIHTEHGFGYSVCGDCYAREWERERVTR